MVSYFLIFRPYAFQIYEIIFPSMCSHPIIDTYATIMNCLSSNIRPQNLILRVIININIIITFHYTMPRVHVPHVLTINSSYFHVYEINSRAIASDH